LGGSRPDKVAAWAFLLGVFLILVAATTSNGATTGGAAPPGQDDADARSTSPLPLSQQLGRAQLSGGTSGDAVRTLQRILNLKGYGPIAETGTFDDDTKQAVERFQRASGLAVDGVVGPQTRPALLRLMSVRTATWYGPGFYGRRTACGQRLTRTTVGVAHKTLPCGTKVTFYHRGRFVNVAVIDRGPYARGVSWDLTYGAARKLGMTATSAVRAVYKPAR
jgi:rare lipoprotein A (peptidoglycan hydrolase)